MKTCTICKEDKNETTDFYKNSKAKSGYENRCKECHKALARKERVNVRTCQWCQTEIKPADKANRVQRSADGPTYLYHSPCMGKYLKTLKTIATLLD